MLDALTVCKQSSFAEKDALRIIHQIFEAMKYCKEKNLPINDIWPENLLLMDEKGSKSVLKVANYGVTNVARARARVERSP